MIQKKVVDNFTDDRGAIFFSSPTLLNFDYKYLTIGTMKPGSRRGGHYHKRVEEKLLCTTGKILMIINDEDVVLKPGELVDIPVNKKHTLYNIGDEMASFVEFKSEEYNEKDKDTYTKW